MGKTVGRKSTEPLICGACDEFRSISTGEKQFSDIATIMYMKTAVAAALVAAASAFAPTSVGVAQVRCVPAGHWASAASRETREGPLQRQANSARCAAAQKHSRQWAQPMEKNARAD